MDKPINTIEKIISWSQKELPDWQQDAVRRILAQQSISAVDITELYAMLRARVDMLQEGEAVPAHIPASTDNGASGFSMGKDPGLRSESRWLS